jgi:hypothetical protein
VTFDFAHAKASARRTVNTVFGVQAFYTDASISTPIETRARWHSRIAKPYGDLYDGAGYSEVVEGIDRIVLIPEDINGFPFSPVRNGQFTFPSIPGLTFTLEYRDPTMGPPAQAWSVTKE